MGNVWKISVTNGDIRGMRVQHRVGLNCLGSTERIGNEDPTRWSLKSEGIPLFHSGMISVSYESNGAVSRKG